MATAAAVEQRARGIGIVRVSEEGDRGIRLGSDTEQEAVIRREADRRNIDLIDVVYERNRSGHARLERREFGKVIERVERKEAHAIIFAYRDRTDRSIEEGSRAIRRMDKAGGVLIAGGQVLSHQTAAQWREATFGSFLAEDFWRTTRERSMNNVDDRIAKLGIVPYRLPLGLVRNEDGSVRVDAKLRPVVRKCFEMRARGATIAEVRAYLAEQDIARSYRSVQIMLKSPLYIGELHWRGQVYEVCKPIVKRATWDAVDRMRVPSGRTAKSELLLSRQGVLRCASCGGRMVAGGAWATYTTAGGETRRTRYAFYKCGRGKDQGCENPVSISAARLEEHVIDRVKEVYADGRGTASRAAEARDAAVAYDEARAAREEAEERFMLLPKGSSHGKALTVVQRLAAKEDELRGRAERLAASSVTTAKVVDAAKVLDDPRPAALPIKRGLIRLALVAITVEPGRGPVRDRVRFEVVR